MPQVEELHSVAGEYDFLAKIRTTHARALEDVIYEIKAIAGVARTTSTVVLNTELEDRPLDLRWWVQEAKTSEPRHRDRRPPLCRYAPNPGSLGWLAGSHWLGRCAALLQPLQQLAIDGVTAEDLHHLDGRSAASGMACAHQCPLALAPGADWIALHQAAAPGAQPGAVCAATAACCAFGALRSGA